MEQYMLAFESNLAPIVGQQLTLSSSSSSQAQARLELLMARANVGECDLVAKGQIARDSVGFLYLGGGRFKGDRKTMPSVTDAMLRLLVSVGNGTLTYTCVPPGSGPRIGIDRDLDGILDGDEVDFRGTMMDASATP